MQAQRCATDLIMFSLAAIMFLLCILGAIGSMGVGMYYNDTSRGFLLSVVFMGLAVRFGYYMEEMS